MISPNLITEEVSSWLLDPADQGASYLALSKLTDLDYHDPKLVESREIAHQNGPIQTILDAMHPDGYWEKEGAGYLPKYKSSVWSLILLSQLGAKIDCDTRIKTACEYYLENAFTPNGQISSSGTPGGTVDCLQGNMLSALLDLGLEDPRLDQAFEWMARSLTGEGVAPMGQKDSPLRYYSGKIGPGFQCGSNNKLPCAWGGTKVMLAFAKLPQKTRTPLIYKAIKIGVDFLFSSDPAEAGYPNGWNPKPSGNWWKFGFPVFYVTDILQIAEALVSLGYGGDPRLNNTLQLIKDKQDPSGRWLLEYDYSGKTWVDFGPKKTPSKWVTIRALDVIRRC
jgi:hypothetical protein